MLAVVIEGYSIDTAQPYARKHTHTHTSYLPLLYVSRADKKQNTIFTVQIENLMNKKKIDHNNTVKKS